MKKVSIFLLFFLLILGGAFAQSPLSFKYQAVARDVSNQPYQNANLGLRISLIRDGVSGVVDYSERHLVTTTDFGVFDIQIGQGTVLNGTFVNLDWGSHAYYLKVDLDPDGGTNYINMGTSQLLSVPYALYARKSGNSGGTDDDADPENELQNLTYDPETQQITISEGNSITLNIPAGSTDDQILSLSGTTLTIEGGNAVDLAVIQDGVVDDDADPSNEIQSLSFNPATNELTLSGSNAVTIPSGGTDADADPTNELQDISLTGTNLSITDGSTIDLSVVQDGVIDDDADPGNEIQSLGFNPVTNELTISGSNSVTIPTGGTDADADPTNELQDISLTGTNLSITDGSTIDLSVVQDGVIDADADPANELQTINKAGNTVTLSDGGGSFTDEVDDADANPINEIQSLNFNPVTNELAISGSNSVTIPTGGTDADADPTNELQDISLTGTNLSITDGSTIDLSVVQDGVIDDDADPGNEIQSLGFNPVTNELTISGSNSVTIPTGGTDADADPTNELQDISLTGTNLSISDGSTIDLSVVQDGVIDDDADPGNELQTISKSGNTVTLSDGGGSFTDEVDDADANPINEIQSLNFNPVTNELAISGSNSVTIPTGGADADADPTNEIQSLTFNDNTLSLSNGGGMVTFPGFGLSLPYVDLISISNINAFDIANAAATGTAIAARQGAGSSVGFVNSAAIIGTAQDGHGVVGFTSGAGVRAGVYGRSDNDIGFGVYGRADGTNGIGGHFESVFGPALVTGPGNVGIGDFNPDVKMVVDGDMRVNSDEGSFAIGYPNNGNQWLFSTLASGADLLMQSEPNASNTRTTRLWFKQNGHVGIGSVDPQARLHISGNGEAVRIDGNSPYLSLYSNSVYKGYFWAPPNADIDAELGTAASSSGDLVLSAQGVPRVRLKTNGDFLIGGNTLGGKAVISHNSTNAKPHLLLYENGDGDYARLSFETGPVPNKEWTLEGFTQPSDASSLFNVMYQNGNNSTKMLTVTGAGRVGIGNVNPDEDLVLGSNLNNGWALPAMTIGSNTGGAIQVGSTAGYDISMESSSIFNRARIISSSPAGLGLGEIEMRTNGLSIGDNNPGSPGDYMVKVVHNNFGFNLQRAGTTNHWELYTNNIQGGLELYFNQNFRGSFSHLDGLYVASDRSFKSHIRNMEQVLPKVMDLRPSRYQYIKGNPTARESLGFIAQEVMILFPELVEVSQDERSMGIHSLNYAGFGVLAIKAIQEQQQQMERQQEQIDHQAAEIEGLRIRLARLESLLEK
ncbi:MAG: hypothetical protein DHS20C18_01320 [Saprospiraceae bacterium]|nr:MAG: hypothetical protein DHS20C18_01320 [Saprospiraceae bacterium]